MKKFLLIFIGVFILFQGVFGFVSLAQARSEAFSTNDSKGQPHTFSINVDDNGLVVEVREITDGGNNLRLAGEKEGEDYWVYGSDLGKVKQQLTTYLNSTEGQKNADQKREAIENRGGYTPPPKVLINACIKGYNFAGIPEFDLNGCIFEVTNFLLGIASWVLWIAATIFNYSLDYSLNFGEKVLSKLQIVDIGWRILRDVANITFIFLLLAIAIGTILRVESYNVKKLLIRVIVVAVLLNFSLFFTKVVIDASNILALQVYSKITVDGGTGVNGEYGDRGISQVFMKGLRITSVYSTPEGKQYPTIQGLDEVVNTTGAVVNATTILIGGIIIILILSFVFLAATVLFIVRSLVLMFLMILSPLAFVALVLPGMRGNFDKWWKTLISQSFFAPLYMLMLYITVSVMNEPFVTNNGEGSFADALAGSGSITIIYSFLIIIGFMIGSLIVAKNMGAYGGDFARNMAGKATFGVAGWTGRQTAGRLAQKVSDSDLVARMRNKNGLGIQRSMAGFIDNRAKGSYDMRNTSLGKMAAGTAGGLGTAGGAGGIRQVIEDQRKRSSNLKKMEEESRVKRDLEDAVAKGDVTKVREILKGSTNSEYSKFGKKLLTNQLVIDNSNVSQIKSITDDKNESFDPETKKNIKAGRTKALTDELAKTTPNPVLVAGAMSHLSAEEKAELPEQILNNHLVYKNFGKKEREALEKRDITSQQRTEIVDVRKEDLKAAIDPVHPAHNPLKLEGALKNLSGKEIHDAIGDSGFFDPTTGDPRPEIIKHISPDQLKQLEKKIVNNFDRKKIGDAIRADKTSDAYNYVKSGKTLPGGGTVSSGEGYEQWE